MGGLGREGRARAGLASLALALGLACASTPESGTRHVVRPGETVYRIARHYGVSVDDVISANRIRDVRKLQVGRQLVIPGSRRPPPSGPLAAPSSRSRKRRSRPPGDAARALADADLRFRWPLCCGVSSGFGWRGGRRHEGIDIPARKGTPVHSAEAGRVIYSGRLSAYGKVVIVKHAGHYSSVYAHNHRNRVRKGEFVEQGQILAEVGSSGNATASHLHFEIRRHRVAEDPLRYLPDTVRAGAELAADAPR